jgi:hypothetical protein
MQLPAEFWRNPDTGQLQELTVIAHKRWKTKNFHYLTVHILEPCALSQRWPDGLDIPLRTGTSPTTRHPYTVRNFLQQRFPEAHTLADIDIRASHTDPRYITWRRAYERHRVQQGVNIARACQAIQDKQSLAASSTSGAFRRQILNVAAPLPFVLPFRDAARNRAWLAAAAVPQDGDPSNLNILASIDMLEPDPIHRGAAMGNPRFRPFWQQAEQAEWTGLWERGCFKAWRRQDLASNDRIFSSRYVYKLKRDARTNQVTRFKARLIVQGFRMEKDIDYHDTFSPTPGATSARTIISLATAHDMELDSVDFTQAFIQADRLPEGVNGRFFIRPPPGSPDHGRQDIVYQVLRPLYGVPSSPRALHVTLDTWFRSQGFEHVGFEESVWRRRADSRYASDIWIGCHVDDSLISCKSRPVLDQFKKDLLTRFQGTDEGPVEQYLGCQLLRDRQHRVSKLVQTAYAERLLKTFDMWDAHPVQTPLEPGKRLVKADCPAVPDPALQRRYRAIVGSLGYLVQMTRADLAFAFSQLSQFLHAPGEAHMAAAMRTLAYLRGTYDAGLTYCDPGPDPGPARRDVLYGWVDSDFAADPDTRRSMTGYLMALNGGPISWRSCRQGGVTISSSEAEFVAASHAAQENIYLRSLLAGFGFPQRQATEIWEDNAACILMSENPVARDRQRHVDVKFHFLRERVRLGELRLIKCHGPRNVADAFTKSLPRPAFHQHREFMWGTRTPFRAFYTRSFSSFVAASTAKRSLVSAPLCGSEICFPAGPTQSRRAVKCSCGG